MSTPPMYQYGVPKGGFLVHIRRGWGALCGYTPSAPDHFLMKDRSGWHYCGPEGRGPYSRKCEKCHHKAEEMGIDTDDIHGHR